ncbi:MAG: hypothetical protein IJ240_00925 [Clostridia bacterium]|nr:hypothetical protein [Clostridia bacterium]
MDTVNLLLQYLKNKRVINDINKAMAETATAQVTLKKEDDLFIRDAITGLGIILKEDLEHHYYITTVKTGTFNNVLSYAIIQRNGSKASIAVYAHEGIVKQKLVQKTIGRLSEMLC